MKRQIALVLLIALAVMTWPAQAQVVGVHTLIDTIIKVAPGENSNLCVQLESGGTVLVVLQTTDGHDDDVLGPPTFSLAPYRTSPQALNAPPEIWNQPATSAKTTIELQVVPDLYCLNLTMATTPDINLLPSRERRARFRYVALRLTLTPQ